jgi:DNA ligase-associated metallophosphoesterase
MNPTLTVELEGEPVDLLAGRGAYWPRERTLFIADPHFGKSATFRQVGLAVPEDTDRELCRLTRLLRKTAAARLIILGDLLHAKLGLTRHLLRQLSAWRALHEAVEVVLVRGNHDQQAGDPPEALGIRCTDAPFRVGPFDACHEPARRVGSHVLAGHVHPGYALAGSSGPSLRSPCFWLQTGLTVLPAFGEFTGLSLIEPADTDGVVVLGDDRLMKIPLGGG